MYHPSQKKFLKLAHKGNLIPVYREITGDLETPVSAYYKVAGKSQYSFLLESIEGEEKIARYSFLAANPKLVVRSRGSQVEILKERQGTFKVVSSRKYDNPLNAIREIMTQYRFVPIAGLPRFCGGMVGYLGYDIVNFFEKLPQTTRNDLKLPDTLLVLAKDIVIFDHRNHKIKVVSSVKIDPKSSKAAKIKQYAKAVARIEHLAQQLHQPLKSAPKLPEPVKLKVSSNVTKPQFKKMVSKAKEYIRAGDIIQVVLSQRFEVSITTDPFDIYRSLRVLNPSPYMYYLNFKDVQIVGSSPELLVRCEDGTVETRPIAGTRRRGQNEQEDQALARDLLKDPKERAEHIMLVDLGRNDLGRVCRKGTVQLSEFMSIEKYSHVMHIVSNIKGKLKPQNDLFDVLQAAFPAGTVSGAPKIRAMEIIDELENVKRGPYAGCIGYFSFSQNLDTCITIRTIVIKKDKAYVQAGAGIVADSNPAREFQETVNKAKAQITAIQMAHQ